MLAIIEVYIYCLGMLLGTVKVWILQRIEVMSRRLSVGRLLSSSGQNCLVDATLVMCYQRLT